MINRRQLVVGAAAAAMAQKWSCTFGEAKEPYARSRYDQAVVIDAPRNQPIA